MLTKGGQAGFSNLDEYFASMLKLVVEKKISSRIGLLIKVRNVLCGFIEYCHCSQDVIVT